MAVAGCELHADLTQLAVMWVLEVLKHLRTFLRLVREADEYFAHERPDAVVLIDYPGFNWHIARKAKAHGIPVIYYGTPQLWAWASWRVAKMRRYVDHVLCKLPFEEAWFRERGCRATFIGHPYFDELAAQRLDEVFLQELRSKSTPLVTILPGSRTQEIKGNLPQFLQTVRKIRSQVTDVRFAVAVFKKSQRSLVERLVAASGERVDVFVARTPELIHAARCCLACSGSVSLELLYHRKPTAILYKVSRFGYFVQQFFRKVRYITLVNLLTAPEPFPTPPVGNYALRDPRDTHVLMPEYLTDQDRSAELATHVVEWLTNDELYGQSVEKLEKLANQVGQHGASRRAADYISKVMTADLADSDHSQCAA
jgi:lipid-A-disaccharide synthase